MELQAVKKKNKILFCTAKKSGSCHEINNINKIEAKASKKRSYSSSNSSSSDSYSHSYLYSDSERDELRQPTEREEINKLHQVVIDNIKKNKNQHNDPIEYEPKFDNIFILFTGTKDPLTVVTVSLRGGNTQRETILAGLTCLWDSRANTIMIQRQPTKPYGNNIRYNKVEHSTAIGTYCTTLDVRVPFCMPDFSNRKIIPHRFHVDNRKGKSEIGYDMIIGRDLMLQLGLSENFKHQILQWYGISALMKEPLCLLYQADLTSREMSKVIMQTEEPFSIRESIDRLVKIINSIYAKENIKQAVNNTTSMNTDKITQLMRLLKDFEDLFAGVL